MTIDKVFDTEEGRAGLHIGSHGNNIRITSSGQFSISESTANSIAQTLLDNAVMSDVTKERERQNAKWGVQNHPNGTGSGRILYGTDESLDQRSSSELAEIFKQKTDDSAYTGDLTWRDILLEEVFEALAEEDLEKLRTELVQVAAVAVQWAEAIDRREDDNEA